jgi:tetratricopeptide (TPR) repeat protein
VQVKGVSRPIDAYELVAATTARTRVQAAGVRGLTPLVGRETEIQIFKRRVEQTAAGRGQILAMVGEPGMGKSRLVHEFARHQLPPGWLVLEGASVSYGKATPYFPLIEMLRRYFQIRNEETGASIQDLVAMHILELDNSLKDTIAPMLSLLGALPDDKPLAPNRLTQQPDIGAAIQRFNAMDPQQRRRQTLEAVKRLFVRESQRQPILAVFEDLHWIDNETQAFLDGLIESLPLARFFLVVNYRPGYSHAWGDKTFYTQLRVEPLQQSRAEELLGHLLGSNKDLAPLKAMLLARTEGNPFFAEESVRSLVETGFLVGEKGAYRPRLKIDAIHIPNTVQNLLADRIDRLPLDEKRLLQTAAVIGVVVPFQLLRTVADIAEEELFRYLAHLQAAEFLYESNLFPDLEYSFKHALTVEVAYGALLHDRKATLHARVVDALEATAQTAYHDHIERLAHHAFSGELWDKAVVYLKDAGNTALSRSSFRNAMIHFEHALAALRHLPKSPDNVRRGIDLRIEIRNALFVFKDFGRAFEFLEEAIEAATGLDDHERLGKLFTCMTAHWNLQGNSEQAVTTGKQALKYCIGHRNIDTMVVAHNWLGVAYHNLGQFNLSICEIKEALSLIPKARDAEFFGTNGIVSVNCKGWLIRGLAQVGSFKETLRYGEEAIQTATERDYPLSMVFAYYSVGAVALIQGDFVRSIAALEQALSICEAAEIPIQRPLVVSGLAAAYAFVGRFDDALGLLESIKESSAQMSEASESNRQALLGKAMSLVWEVQTYMLAGHYTEAEARARRGLAVFPESRLRGSEAWLRYLLGSVLARVDPIKLTQAEASIAKALALAQHLSMRPLQAHCYLELGQIHARSKCAEAVRSELHVARELYQSMEMAFWLAKSEILLAAMG